MTNVKFPIKVKVQMSKIIKNINLDFVIWTLFDIGN